MSCSLTLAGSAQIEVRRTPPSINEIGVGRAPSRGAAIAQGRVKRQLQSELEQLLLVELGRRRLGSVVASAELRFPKRSARRDEGNYRAPLEKALGDALVNGGWIEDDHPELFRFERVTFDPDRGPARTRLHLRYEARHGA